jgi:hypothetical protein
MADNNAQKTFKEIPIAVKQWGGMVSNLPTKVIPPNAFALLLNMDFRGLYKIRSRQGTTQYHATIGSVQVIEGIEFKKSTDVTATIIEATSDGKLYRTIKGLGNTPVLIGSLANSMPTRVSMAQMANNLYIADGKRLFEWDGTTLADVTSRLPSIAPLTTGDILDVIATRYQLWVADSNDYLYGSVFNTPSDFTTVSAGAYKTQVQYGDGCKIASLVSWGNTFLINKVDDERDLHLMFWLKGIGSSTDPYYVDPLFGNPKSPTAFVGKSACEVGADIIGLTLGGITTISAINNFKEATPSNAASQAIDDLVKRINFKMPSKINGIFDTITRQYMLAVPLDGATSVTHILVYDIDADRWSTYDNWEVRCWVRVGTDILFGTEDGRLVKTRVGDSDEGSGYLKKIITGDNDFDAPDVTKMFKSCELDIQHEGDYNINYDFYVDNILATSNAVKLPLVGNASLWDVFVWDVDYWDALGNTVRNILLMARGRTIRHQISNSQPNQPFTIESMTTRILVKDSGQAKAN